MEWIEFTITANTGTLLCYISKSL